MQARITAHVAARAACLIALPAAIYLAAFALHFAVLTQSGPGDGSMPSLFQAGLNGTKLVNQPRGPCTARRWGERARARTHSCDVVASSRGRVWVDGDAAQQRAGRRPAALARPDVPGGEQAAAGLGPGPGVAQVRRILSFRRVVLGACTQVTGYSHLDGNNYWTFVHATKFMVCSNARLWTRAARIAHRGGGDRIGADRTTGRGGPQPDSAPAPQRHGRAPAQPRHLWYAPSPRLASRTARVLRPRERGACGAGSAGDADGLGGQRLRGHVHRRPQ